MPISQFARETLLVTTALMLMGAMSACTDSQDNTPTQSEAVTSESERLNNWFETRFDEEVSRSPMTSTYLGLDVDQDKLDNVSRLAKNETAALTQAWLDELRQSFDLDRLDKGTKLSRRLFEYASEDSLENHLHSENEYVFQHMSGPHSDLPSFLINFHQVDNEEDAKNYISRLRGFNTYLGQYADHAEQQANKGVVLPKFVYPKIREAARNIISGAPFTGGEDSPLWSDITGKIDELKLGAEKSRELKNSARTAMIDSVGPAYESLLAMFLRHESMATTDDGIWKLPNGEAYYQARLKHYTTTHMSADEIHEIGLKEVDRIHTEMRNIMKTVGFEGSLQEFFTFLRTDPKFSFKNDDDGRQAYITQATDMIDAMKNQLDSLFITKPKADMIVKRVEPFREATAFGAFYDQPAVDGSRPGTYYINLKDMSELPIYQMQALAYHEGIPGHHMQIAIGMELGDLPKFRTLGGHTAYIEGWALYAESVPAELGLYTDPYQDFGRLSMEIFRAARLVLDTGIHSKKWTREQAVDYMMKNTANSEGDIRAEIDRYIVWPGQATAYKIGMIKIQDLRSKSEEQLGDKFDVREFHDVVLANGSVPLSILEELVDDWIAAKK